MTMIKIYERGCNSKASRYLRRIPISEIIHGINTDKGGYLHHDSRILCQGNLAFNSLIKNVSHLVKQQEEVEELEMMVASSLSQTGQETNLVPEKLVRKLVNLNKVFLSVNLGKLNPQQRHNFGLQKTAEMIELSTKYTNFELLVNSAVQACVNQRFRASLAKIQLDAQPMDIISKDDLILITQRVIYRLLGTLTMNTDNYLYLERKYLIPIRRSMFQTSLFDDSKSKFQSSMDQESSLNLNFLHSNLGSFN